MCPTSRYDDLIIKGGRVIDPYAGVDETRDIHMHHGRYVDRAEAGATEINASGLIVCPGLLDIHVHLREPGQSHAYSKKSTTSAMLLPMPTPPR